MNRAQVVLAWVETMGREFEGIEPTSAKQEAAYAQWFDQHERREGRRARLAEADALGAAADGSCWVSVRARRLHVPAKRIGARRLIQAVPIGSRRW